MTTFPSIIITFSRNTIVRSLGVFSTRSGEIAEKQILRNSHNYNVVYTVYREKLILKTA